MTRSTGKRRGRVSLLGVCDHQPGARGEGIIQDYETRASARKITGRSKGPTGRWTSSRARAWWRSSSMCCGAVRLQPVPIVWPDGGGAAVRREDEGRAAAGAAAAAGAEDRRGGRGLSTRCCRNWRCWPRAWRSKGRPGSGCARWSGSTRSGRQRGRPVVPGWGRGLFVGSWLIGGRGRAQNRAAALE